MPHIVIKTISGPSETRVVAATISKLKIHSLRARIPVNEKCDDSISWE